MDDIFEAFDKGVRFIYREGEFADSDQAIDASIVGMDNDGWQINNKQEEFLHEPRSAQTSFSASGSSSEETSSSEQSSDDEDDNSDVGNESNDDLSSTSSQSSSSPSSSSYSSYSSASLDEDKSLLPANVNKALGSDNIGFKMLSKLGWREGEGLGAESEGIREPICLNTRFGNPRGGKRKRGQKRAALDTGRTEKRKAALEDNLDPAYADYRKRKSSDYHKRFKRANKR
ncbi:hypothetical protein LPJ73_000611 [Coemansia sp. RSA 2703]|nr:hypothetical protein LPJ73_000611 [Coemansia sp. RSA 2703]